MKFIPHAKLLLLATSFAVPSVSGQTLFSDNFDVNSSANWTVNSTVAGVNSANFFFNYSTIGIPSAPNSIGGSTIGLKLTANTGSGTAASLPGISVSPTGQSFSGNYELRFDMWLNYNGPLGPTTVGGNGSTQAGGGGIGTAGTSAQIAGTASSIHFSVTGDGGSSVDYRAYSSVAPSGYLDASGVFAAGTTTGVRNSSSSYYNSFGGASAPAAQTALFSQQTGTTQAGAQGFAWRDVSIMKLDSTVTFTIDGLLIATVDASTATLSGGNILLNYYDTNNNPSTDPNDESLLFALMDNVRVTQIVTPVPEPGTMALAGVGVAAVALAIRRKRS